VTVTAILLSPGARHLLASHPAMMRVERNDVMSTSARRAALAFSLPLILLLPATTGFAKETAPVATSAPVLGAMPNDKAMTCEMIAGERAAINEAVASKTLKKEKSAKLKKGLFGFAKGMATVMVPGAALLGGNSMIGSLAAQGASQQAAQMINGAGSAPKPVEAAQPSTEQQARLARLDAIGAYRQCAA
jgi:hypothetical protein